LKFTSRQAEELKPAMHEERLDGIVDVIRHRNSIPVDRGNRGCNPRASCAAYGSVHPTARHQPFAGVDDSGDA
jgi:hypothetical protein